MNTLVIEPLHNRTSLTDAIARTSGSARGPKEPIFSDPERHHAARVGDVVALLGAGERMLETLGRPDLSRIVAQVRADVEGEGKQTMATVAAV